MASKTLILIRPSKRVETNAIVKITNPHSNNYLWVEIGVRIAETSRKPR